jgi:hypothetical protein
VTTTILLLPRRAPYDSDEGFGVPLSGRPRLPVGNLWGSCSTATEAPAAERRLNHIRRDLPTGDGAADARPEPVQSIARAWGMCSGSPMLLRSPTFGSVRPAAAVPPDRETLLTRFNGIRQFARGGRRPQNKPLLLLYTLARLKRPPGRDQVQHDRGRPAAHPRMYGPWGASARASYPYSRLIGNGLWQPPGRADLFGLGGNIREGVAGERDTAAASRPRYLSDNLS